MCGIAGLISDTKQFSRFQLENIVSSLSHRGPNGSSTWTNPGQTVHLGHQRLAVIDLSPAAAQPMNFLDRFTIVHNGEIYNYPELKSILQRKGYVFQTASDTEVILAAFDCWGVDCLNQFDGMFAFAIWDEREKKLFAARDRFGQKPFYYTIDENNRSFAFASEIKAFKDMGSLSQINQRQLLLFLSNGFTNDPTEPINTFYSSVFQLPPAHFLWFSASATNEMFVVKSWWDLDKERQDKIGDTEAIEKFRELFQQSVSRSFRSDIPIGTCLSGGLDSSSIVAMASTLRENNNSYKVFSAVFPGFEKDESSYSALVAQQFGLEQFSVGTMNLPDEFDSFLHYQDEPVASAGVFAQFKVFELAKNQGIRVLLDGQGADEILAGYSKYIHWFLQEMWMSNRSVFRKERISLRANGQTFSWSWKNYVAAAMPAQAALQLEKRALKNIKASQNFNREFVRNNHDHDLVYKPFVAKLNDILYFNACQGGLQELLRYADRNSMAHGCEVRLPFLNHELVEFIFSLPSTLKIRDGYTKWILRKSMENILPGEIAWRKDKVGFEPPQEKWMSEKKMLEFIREAKTYLVQERILDRSVLEKKIQPHGAHAADSFDWRYLSAARWLQHR
jgi:asparagine synthase (glutamine-hydrolysing)